LNVLHIESSPLTALTEIGQLALASADLRALFDEVTARLSRRFGADVSIAVDVPELGIEREAPSSTERSPGDVRVPIEARERPLGVIGVARPSLRADELQLLESVAAILAGAIERHEREAALRRNEQKFRGIFESSLDAIAIHRHPRGPFLEVNEEFERLSGFRRAEVVGVTAEELGIWENDRETYDDVRDVLLDGGIVQNREVRFRLQNGTVAWMLYSAARVDLGGEPCVLSFMRDIGSLKRAEEDLSQARDEALEGSRLKSAFLANMSHEIRTPLNIILGYNSLVSDHLEEVGDHSQESLFDVITRASKRLIQTIDGILDLSTLEAGGFEIKPQPISVRAVTERVFEELSPVGRRKGLSLSLSAEAGSPVVLFDEYCLTQAIAALLGNAIKFTESGGVAARLHRDDGGALCLEVSDTGVGIDKPYLQKLFEPFSQEDSGYARRYEGTGLGLALTRKYLDLNGARVSVESEKGSGSTFRIHFAKSSELGVAAAPREKEVRRSAQTDFLADRPRVLIVEDDFDTQAYMKVLLRDRYEVSAASSAEEARRELEEFKSEIRIILMDLSLKGSEDGLQLTSWIREQPEWRGVPIVATTAHAFSSDRAHALEAGCNAYLAKPFDYEELFSVMADLLASPALLGVAH
jgi:PAS domain S-box-containing protein